jgi:CDP-diacylglycerol--glycerol-3-phosphate 3-phosphatidyltransferase
MTPTPTPAPGRATFLSDLKLIPNLLCIYRIIAITISAFLAFYGLPLTGLLIGITAGLTDYLDGYLARKWNQCTELGALLDGLADLLFAFVCLILATSTQHWPLYTLLLWGLRDISIAFVRTSAAQLGFTIPSIFLGKLASNFNFYSFVLFGLDLAQPFGPDHFMSTFIHWFGLFGIHTGIALQWISGAIYIRRYIDGYRTQPLGAANRTS